MRIGAWRAAATLLALALPAPAVAQAALPTDPEFRAAGSDHAGWARTIHWTPPNDDVAWPVIAVVDTGMWAGFDDFAGFLDDQSADCVGRRTAKTITDPAQVNDTDGHGTQVATVAAAPANGKGSVGVSPDSQLIVVRVTTDGTTFSAACAFDYLATIASQQLLVVNLSFTTTKTTEAEAALQRLIRAGALVVAATGNFTKPAGWPANAQHVLAVGRSDAGLSAGGPALDVVAPGGGIRLPELDGSWRTGQEQGTSYASPIVAGVAARVWGAYGDVTDPQVIAYLLRRTAQHKGATFDRRRGFGTVDLRAATSVPAAQVPVPRESEPNDTRGTASRAPSCTRGCTLTGIIATSDDALDYWRLNRGRCPRGALRVKTGRRIVAADCFRRSGRGGGTFVKVSFPRSVARRGAQQLYVVSVPRR